MYVFNWIEDHPDLGKESYYKYLYFLISSILLGVIGVYFYFPKTFLTVAVLVLINFLYSKYLKKFSLLVAIFFVAVTGSLKMLLGIILAEGKIATFLPILFCNYLSSICFHAFFVLSLTFKLLASWLNLFVCKKLFKGKMLFSSGSTISSLILIASTIPTAGESGQPQAIIFTFPIAFISFKSVDKRLSGASLDLYFVL
ncbi:hypothetical protein CO058_01965 [candidate division WWE3 bacterium CG_4_9_14_0_2_um_filter_35_11]|uniref:Uncharacterized protein n=1 Tax=candidate division WWE3 bacterium CG_4_9_14_0_2_um_filter_35_11 TaxID=1975077 RepID=A0A2M8ELX8_UNCKA|nr:MAG: hypothetical protein COV25_01000 [candidate division WWE3 bacterium CG10_big_fil_rev_8_21_14_0_10_35_32]PJC23742.1 MAG: hypothetical protein CO058_01965 [candidate division WWE3 bacterium CG_4_9_14_0_2_um_filter_35_11]